VTRPGAAPKAQVDLEGYLLGRVSGPERKRIEAMLFEDRQVLSSLQAAEDDLIDRYVEGGLAAADRRAFEEHFAASPPRQERVAFRRALVRSLSGTETAALGPTAHRAPASAPSVRGRRAAPWLGLAALLVVGLWLAGNPGRTVTPLPPKVPPRAPTASPPQTAGGVSPATGDGSEPSLPDRPALLLQGGLRRGAGRVPRFAVSSRTTVRLDAVVGGGAAAKGCAAGIRTETAVVWSGACRHTGQPDRVSVVAPATVLAPGDYVLRVVLDRNEREAAEFLFRVLPDPTPSP
jgi:hypothetical protein